MSHATPSSGPTTAAGAQPGPAPDPGDAPPVVDAEELRGPRTYGRMLRLLDALPDAPFDAVVRRSQRPTMPPRKLVDRRLVTRERIGRADRSTPGVPVTWIDRPRAARATVVHLHGGAYATGEAPAHWRWLEELRRRSESAAAMVHYRMPPSSPFPAALDDALAAVRDLTSRAIVRGGAWVLSGDSAGGGLALAVLDRLRAEGGDLPAGVLLNSPWTDLTLSDPLIEEVGERDLILTRHHLERCAGRYAAGGELGLRDPRVSPRFGSVVGFPPVMLVSGTADLLLGDARALRTQLEEAGVPLAAVELPDGQHDHAVLAEGPLAQWAMRRQIAFVRRACGLRD